MSEIREFARRLVASEATHDQSPPVDGGEVVKVFEKMRAPLAKLAGVAGFRSLMTRALALAKAEAPALDGIQVRLDGSLDIIDGLENFPNVEAGIVVIAELLGLLVTFIGEPLTLRLVSEAWPHAPVIGIGAGSGEKS
jgi:hypothetical protein